jgi:hypothetical protein
MVLGSWRLRRGSLARGAVGARVSSWALNLVLVAAVLSLTTGAQVHGSMDPTLVRLTLVIQGGKGRVKSDPSGIDCPTVCSALFAAWSKIYLNPHPAPRYAFYGVSDPAVDSDCPYECFVQLSDHDEQRTVYFYPRAGLELIPNSGSIHLNRPGQNPGDGVSQSCVSTEIRCRLYYLPGTKVVMTAVPATGRHLLGWSDGRCRRPRPCSMRVVNGDTSLAALFTPVSISVVVRGNGTVRSSPPSLGCNQERSLCTGDFRFGTTVRLIAEPGSDASWALCAATGPICTVRLLQDERLVVDFGGSHGSVAGPAVNVTFRVHFSGNGRGEVTTGRHHCHSGCTLSSGFGASLTLKARPDRGSRFARWIGGCGTHTRCRLTVGPVTSVWAVFQRKRRHTH